MRGTFRRRLRAISAILAALVLGGAICVWGQEVQAPPQSSKPTILSFGRGLCANCKQMEQILERIKAKYGDQVEVRLLLVDKDEALFHKYRVMLVPTQVFLDASGKEVFRHTGFFPPELLEKKLRELKFIRNRGK